MDCWHTVGGLCWHNLQSFKLSFQNVCGYYISYVTLGDSLANAVILPNMVTEVTPSTLGIITSLEVPCSYRGTYILHIEGNGAKSVEPRCMIYRTHRFCFVSECHKWLWTWCRLKERKTRPSDSILVSSTELFYYLFVLRIISVLLRFTFITKYISWLVILYVCTHSSVFLSIFDYYYW